jgi:N-acetylmuramoyl-L-alanine amidase
MRSFGRRCAIAAVLSLTAAPVTFAQSNVDALYQEATRREALLRQEIDGRAADAPPEPLLERARTLARTFEDIARLFPRSGYSDDALWQGAVLAADAFWEFGDAVDRTRALRLFDALGKRYPTSTLLKQVPSQTARLAAAPAPMPDARRAPSPVRPAPGATSSASRPPSSGTPEPVRPAPPATPAAVPPTAARAAAQPARPASTLRAIRREVLPDAVRVTLELEREVQFYDERIEGPARVFVDLRNTRPVEPLKDAALAFSDDVVRQIRVARQQDAATRVVLELQDAARHSGYALYNPYRIVLDFERIVPRPAAAIAPKLGPPIATLPATTAVPAIAPRSDTAIAPPSKNGAGGFSLSRQLGLGVARIVIDAGHGGHDPGAQVRGLNEAELTLDIAVRLEKLLAKQPGVEVVLTRRSNAYVSLEERTAIANRGAADLFLSIHANASADARARGIETYFLNFASNSAAEALAARENAGSSRTMRELPDIVKAIALNNKIDESRDFASFVQSSMYDRLRRANKEARNLGVKQAPFVVLIAATMPSILAEISFLTNRQEATLLRTPKYREQIAEALAAGVMKYQKSLKASGAIATR